MFGKISETENNRRKGEKARKNMENPKNKKSVAVIVICLVAASAVTVSLLFTVRYYKYKNAPLSLSVAFTVTGHTGCMGEKDNSLEAMRAAIGAGADIVEFDLNFNKDKVPVLCHDEPQGGEVTLEEAFILLSENPNILANIDAKSTENLAAVEKLVKKYMLEKQLFFTGIEEKDIPAVRKDCPSLPYYLNVNVQKSRTGDESYLQELASKVISSGAVGINMNKRAVTKELCDFFRSKGILVSIYTVDSVYDMYRVLSCGPDNITSRKPDKLISVINEKKK